MRKDWGFSALVELAGKRILFDTGNDAEVFAANVKAKGVDLTNLSAAVPIGITCRLCERTNCQARAFPSLQFPLRIDEHVRGVSFFAPAGDRVG
jgi:predicted transcriptional regulator